MKPYWLLLSSGEEISMQKYLQKKKISFGPGMSGTSHECHTFPGAAHGTTHCSLFVRWGWALWRHYLIYTHTDGWQCVPLDQAQQPHTAEAIQPVATIQAESLFYQLFHHQHMQELRFLMKTPVFRKIKKKFKKKENQTKNNQKA